jgi:hypothetical protein
MRRRIEAMDSYRLFRAGALSGAATLVVAFVLLKGDEKVGPEVVDAVAPEASPEVADASELTAQLATLLETLPASPPLQPSLPLTEIRRIVAEMPAELLPPEPVEAIAAAAMEALAETGAQPEIEVSASRLAEAEEIPPVWTPAAGALPDAALADAGEGWLAAAGINDGTWEIRPLPRRN